MKIKVLTAAMILAFAGVVRAQEAKPTPQTGFKQQISKPPANDPLSKPTSDDPQNASFDYLESLRKLLALYQEDVRKAEERLAKARKSFASGVIDERELDQIEKLFSDAKHQVAAVQKMISDVESKNGPQTSYDRFTDVTTVWIPYEDLDVSSHHDLAIMAFYTYRGKDADKPEYIGFGFASTPHDLSSRLERSELYVLADGERVPLGQPTARNSKAGFRYTNTITEFLEYKITLQLLKKIAYSRNVAMRLDSFEFDLRQGFLRSMQKLISEIPNPKTTPSPKRPSLARGVVQELRARLSAGEYSGDERLRNLENGGATLDQTTTVKAVDLNGAGASGFILKISSRDFCGSGGCETWLYRAVRGRYVFMLSADEITPMKTMTNGYRDLASSRNSGAYEIWTQFYRFDGQHYEPWKCVIKSYDQETKQWTVTANKCSQ